MDLLTPKLDFVFKKLFTSDTDLLVNLLNSVLQLPENRHIRSVKVKNPIILPEEITKKFIILDILATDESGQTYEIEMQVRQYDWYSKRCLYYASRIYAGQLDSGEEYDKLLPVIGIHFLDYEEFPDYEELRTKGFPLSRTQTDRGYGVAYFRASEVRKTRKKRIRGCVRRMASFFQPCPQGG